MLSRPDRAHLDNWDASCFSARAVMLPLLQVRAESEESVDESPPVERPLRPDRRVTPDRRVLPDRRRNNPVGIGVGDLAVEIGDRAASTGRIASTTPRRVIAQRLGVWLLYIVAVSVIPVVAIAMNSWRAGDISYVGFFRDGELILISVAIVGGSLVELFPIPRTEARGDFLRAAVVGVALLFVVLCAMEYSDIQSDRGERIEGSQSQVREDRFVAYESLVAFATAVVIGASCIVISGARDVVPGRPKGAP